MTEQTAITKLAEGIQTPLRLFLSDIGKLDGVKPRAVFLVGPAARGEFSPANPEINLLLVFDAIHAELVEALAALGVAHGRRGIRAPLLLTVEYIENARDCFPIELLDLSKNHVLLEGDDLLETLAIDRAYLRLQVERELRSLRVALRQQYLRAATDAAYMAAWFRDAVTDVFPVFRALLHLLGGDPATGNTEATTRLERATGVDLSAFVEVWNLHKKAQTIDKAEVRRMFDRWETGAARLVEQVDALSN